MFDFSELIFLTLLFFFFFFNDTATPEIYPLSLHDALPICEELHHLAAWLRASSFEEAQMARGDSRLGRERQLTQVPRVAPLAQLPAKRRHHRMTIRKPKQRIHGTTPNHHLRGGSAGNYLSGKD